LNFFDEEMETDPDLNGVSLLVIIDSSSPLQVIEGSPGQWPKFRVIDHHSDLSHWDGDHYIDDSKGACVELALQMAMLINSPLTKEMAMAGIAGIVADTGKYRFASPVDLEVTSFLLGGSETTMEDVLNVIEGEDYFDVSKKVAQLKAMKRVQYFRVGDQVIATSRVNSFEAAACRTLLVAGADVAFVSAEKRDELRVSSRAKPHILKMGIHLGHFMEKIGTRTGNQGGGHDGAAGLNGKGKAGEVLSICMDEMSSLLADKLGITHSSRHVGRNPKGHDGRNGRNSVQRKQDRETSSGQTSGPAG
jgi:nanoRNase/pAp phosphatase (c-di-AMP/oligoRNAs hydrolase)